ncbi:MAG: ATP synthase F0 subunit B [Desulfobacterales bacterium]|jgi:F-type H+-transporting ATPase subunit b|nr:ATP synthase F0 subunit B [Desulfobacterales bacterium]
MKKPGGHGQDRFRKARAVVFAGLTLCLIFSAGLAFGSSEGEAGPKGWVKTDTYRVINFVVLAGALVFLLRKPISQALKGRIDGIREQLEELEAKKKEAEKQLANYNEKLSQMDREAETIVAAYIKQGEETKARLIEEAKAAAEKLEAQAQRNIEHHFKQAKSALQAEIIAKALAKAEAVIKESISDNDQDRLVTEYLDKVVA